MEECRTIRLPEVVVRHCARKVPELQAAPLSSVPTTDIPKPQFHPHHPQLHFPSATRARSQPRSRKHLFHLPQLPRPRHVTPPHSFLRKLGAEMSPLRLRLCPESVPGPQVLAGGFQRPVQTHMLGLWTPSTFRPRHKWSHSIA